VLRVNDNVLNGSPLSTTQKIVKSTPVTARSKSKVVNTPLATPNNKTHMLPPASTQRHQMLMDWRKHREL
jgi:hypothetical protein